MAEAFVSFLVEQLGSIILQQVEQEVRLVTNVDKEVASLTRNLKAIQDVLQDAGERQVKEANVRRWLNDLKEVSYEMDDVLDEWSTEILKQKFEKEEKEGEIPIDLAKKKKKKVCFPLPSLCICFGQVKYQIISRHDIAVKIRDLNERLTSISNERQSYNFQYAKRDIEQLERLKSSSVVDKFGTFGRDNEKNILVSKLLSENSQERRGPLVIPIVGMGGIGKTTLAQIAFNDEEVKGYFEKRVWVCVSEPFEQVRVAKAIVEGIDGNSTTSIPNELEALVQRMCKSIEGKKFLLVLDDVWDADYRKWEPLMHSLQLGALGSRIVVTTRKEQVAAIMGSATHVIHLKELSEEVSRSLFFHIAFFGKERNETEEFEAIGKEIVKKCKGLPLAAKTLGSLMRYKKTISEWEDVLNSKIWELEEVEQQVFQPLLLSYYDLAPTTKRCLLYCHVFPKDYVIDKDNLIELWMSQDYFHVRENKGKKTTGQMHFDDLVMRSFFQDFEEDYDGNIIRCKMHDIVHDFLHYLTKNEFFILEVGEAEIMELPPDEVRHLTITSAVWREPFPAVVIHCKNLRTLVHFSSAFSNIALELILQLKCLRTLDLSDSLIKEVPKAIGGLIHLRYLDLSYSWRLEELPDTMCDLYNLQTLRLVDCHSLRKLPKDMGKLKKLKHLHVENSHLLRSEGIGRLVSLRTLDQFHAICNDDNEGFKLEDLKNLDQLEGRLSIIHLSEKEANDAKKALLVNKKQVARLELVFNCSCRPMTKARGSDEGTLNALQPNPNVSTLIIEHYNGVAVSPDWLMSLHNLRRLGLYDCKDCEFLPPLGKLPSLAWLSIQWWPSVKKVGVEFLGIDQLETQASPSFVSFPKLKQLSLCCMWDWEEWEGVAGCTEEDSQIKIMPRLSSLVLIGCPRLRGRPDFLHKSPIKNLEDEFSSMERTLFVPERVNGQRF